MYLEERTGSACAKKPKSSSLSILLTWFICIASERNGHFFASMRPICIKSSGNTDRPIFYSIPFQTRTSRTNGNGLFKQNSEMIWPPNILLLKIVVVESKCFNLAWFSVTFWGRSKDFFADWPQKPHQPPFLHKSSFVTTLNWQSLEQNTTQFYPVRHRTLWSLSLIHI